MLQIKLGNGSILDSVTVVREIVAMPEGILEAHIDFEEVSDLKAIYDIVIAPNALNNITVTDLSGVEKDLILTGYNTVRGLERTLNSAGQPGFKLTLRITRE